MADDRFFDGNALIFLTKTDHIGMIDTVDAKLFFIE